MNKHNTLTISELHSGGKIEFQKFYCLLESVYCSYKTFKFGNVVLINCEIDEGGWALSWTLSGALKPFIGKMEFEGEVSQITEPIKIDNIIYTQSDLQNIGWAIGFSGKNKLSKKSIKDLIVEGISKNNINFSFEEIKTIFMLTEKSERYSIMDENIDDEYWRASMAIGFSNNKKIFGFPWMKPSLLKLYREKWIKIIFNFLRENNCLVILPTRIESEMDDILDEIKTMNYADLEHPITNFNEYKKSLIPQR